MTAITFNLDDSLISFIKTFAKKNNITQKEVIQRSLEKTKKELLEEEVKNFFEKMEPEMEEEVLWLANSWLEDYNKYLIKIENEK